MSSKGGGVAGKAGGMPGASRGAGPRGVLAACRTTRAGPCSVSSVINLLGYAERL